jgi:DNA (cytosine-5)-methyltransferase 1
MTDRNIVIDYCAGIGGWELALERYDLKGHGVENARWPVATRLEAGLATVWADNLETLPESIYCHPRVAGFVGSFPCQPFSQANGNADPINVPRAHLIRAGRDHIIAARPAFVCLENVGRAADVMRLLGREIESLGYSWDVRVVNAADHGLPQARKRALFVARLDGRPIVWPAATHRDRRDARLATSGLPVWNTLADAIGRTFSGDEAWGNTMPASTIVGSFEAQMVAPFTYRLPGDGPRQSQKGAIALTPRERLIVQGFPADWPVQGPKTAVDLQIGNAIPPLLADIALRAAGVRQIVRKAA